MVSEAFELSLIEVFNSLSRIPLAKAEESDSLKKITDLGRRALGSHACSLTFVDLENRALTQAACSGFDEGFEKRMKGKEIRLGSLQEEGVFLDYGLIRRG